MIRKIAALTAGCMLLVSTSSCHAVDDFAVELGRGDDRTSLLRIAFTDRWRKAQARQPADDWRLAGYWELAAGVWDNREESTAVPVINFVLLRVQLRPSA